jgi:hypothetical protein
VFKFIAVMLVSLVLAGSAFADNFRGFRVEAFVGGRRPVQRFLDRRDAFRFERFRQDRFVFRRDFRNFFVPRRQAIVVRRQYVAPIVIQEYRAPQQIIVRREYVAPQQVVVQEQAHVEQEVSGCGCASQVRAIKRVVVPNGY